MQPKVYAYYSTVQHSGVESLTMQFAWGARSSSSSKGGCRSGVQERGTRGGASAFWLEDPRPPRSWLAPPCLVRPLPPPADKYPEHLKTGGYNAIEMLSVSNCWVRSVRVIDADNGVHMSQCDLVTVERFSMEVNGWVGGAEGALGVGPGGMAAELLLSRPHLTGAFRPARAPASTRRPHTAALHRPPGHQAAVDAVHRGRQWAPRPLGLQVRLHALPKVSGSWGAAVAAGAAVRRAQLSSAGPGARPPS